MSQEEYGIDLDVGEDGTIIEENEPGYIDDQHNQPVPPDFMSELSGQINPLDRSSQYGIELYTSAKTLLLSRNLAN